MDRFRRNKKTPGLSSLSKTTKSEKQKKFKKTLKFSKQKNSTDTVSQGQPYHEPTIIPSLAPHKWSLIRVYIGNLNPETVYKTVLVTPETTCNDIIANVVDGLAGLPSDISPEDFCIQECQESSQGDYYRVLVSSDKPLVVQSKWTDPGNWSFKLAWRSKHLEEVRCRTPLSQRKFPTASFEVHQEDDHDVRFGGPAAIKSRKVSGAPTSAIGQAQGIRHSGSGSTGGDVDVYSEGGTDRNSLGRLLASKQMVDKYLQPDTSAPPPGSGLNEEQWKRYLQIVRTISSPERLEDSPRDSLAEVEYPRNSGSFSNFESDRSFETCFSGYRGESPNLLSQGYSTAPMPVGSPVLSGRGPRLVPSQTNSPVPSNQSPAPISNLIKRKQTANAAKRRLVRSSHMSADFAIIRKPEGHSDASHTSFEHSQSNESHLESTQQEESVLKEYQKSSHSRKSNMKHSYSCPSFQDDYLPANLVTAMPAQVGLSPAVITKVVTEVGVRSPRRWHSMHDYPKDKQKFNFKKVEHSPIKHEDSTVPRKTRETVAKATESHNDDSNKVAQSGMVLESRMDFDETPTMQGNTNASSTLEIDSKREERKPVDFKPVTTSVSGTDEGISSMPETPVSLASNSINHSPQPIREQPLSGIERIVESLEYTEDIVYMEFEDSTDTGIDDSEYMSPSQNEKRNATSLLSVDDAVNPGNTSHVTNCTNHLQRVETASPSVTTGVCNQTAEDSAVSMERQPDIFELETISFSYETLDAKMNTESVSPNVDELPTQGMDIETQEIDTQTQGIDVGTHEIDTWTQGINTQTQGIDVVIHEIDRRTHEMDTRNNVNNAEGSSSLQTTEDDSGYTDAALPTPNKEHFGAEPKLQDVNVAVGEAVRDDNTGYHQIPTPEPEIGSLGHPSTAFGLNMAECSGTVEIRIHEDTLNDVILADNFNQNIPKKERVDTFEDNCYTDNNLFTSSVSPLTNPEQILSSTKESDNDRNLLTSTPLNAEMPYQKRSSLDPQYEPVRFASPCGNHGDSKVAMKKRDVDVDSDFLLWEYSDVGFIDDDCNPPPSTPHSLPNNESPWNSPSGDSPAFCHHFDEEPVSSEKFRGDTGGHKVRFAAELQTNLYSDSTNGYREEEVYIQEYEFTSDSDSSFGENDGTVQYGTFSPDDVEIPNLSWDSSYEYDSGCLEDEERDSEEHHFQYAPNTSDSILRGGFAFPLLAVIEEDPQAEDQEEQDYIALHCQTSESQTADELEVTTWVQDEHLTTEEDFNLPNALLDHLQACSIDLGVKLRRNVDLVNKGTPCFTSATGMLCGTGPPRESIESALNEAIASEIDLNLTKKQKSAVNTDCLQQKDSVSTLKPLSEGEGEVSSVRSKTEPPKSQQKPSVLQIPSDQEASVTVCDPAPSNSPSSSPKNRGKRGNPSKSPYNVLQGVSVAAIKKRLMAFSGKTTSKGSAQATGKTVSNEEGQSSTNNNKPISKKPAATEALGMSEIESSQTTTKSPSQTKPDISVTGADTDVHRNKLVLQECPQGSQKSSHVKMDEKNEKFEVVVPVKNFSAMLSRFEKESSKHQDTQSQPSSLPKRNSPSAVQPGSSTSVVQKASSPMASPQSPTTPFPGEPPAGNSSVRITSLFSGNRRPAARSSSSFVKVLTQRFDGKSPC